MSTQNKKIHFSAYMSGLDGDLASVDLETVHLLERVFQILGTVKADFAASLANALMGIGVSDLAALAEDVLQFAPAENVR